MVALIPFQDESRLKGKRGRGKADVSLIAPAAGSLTFVSNAVAARWVLHENVDRRWWLAAVLVCCGVALLKH